MALHDGTSPAGQHPASAQGGVSLVFPGASPVESTGAPRAAQSLRTLRYLGPLEQIPVLTVRARPLGVWILSGVIAFQGLGDMAAAYDSLVPTADDWPAAVLRLVVGVLLLNK